MKKREEKRRESQAKIDRFFSRPAQIVRAELVSPDGPYPLPSTAGMRKRLRHLRDSLR